EAAGRLGGLGRAQATAVDPALEVAADALEAAVEGFWIGVGDERSCPRQARKLRAPGAHRAGAGDADRAGCARGSGHYAGTSALIPVRARPMISFWICDVPSYSVVTRASRR